MIYITLECQKIVIWINNWLGRMGVSVEIIICSGAPLSRDTESTFLDRPTALSPRKYFFCLGFTKLCDREFHQVLRFVGKGVKFFNSCSCDSGNTKPGSLLRVCQRISGLGDRLIGFLLVHHCRTTGRFEPQILHN